MFRRQFFGSGRVAWMTVLSLGLLAASVAEAQTVRYISISGNDANACTLAAPCKTLQAGVAAAPASGEVRVLNSGDFGPGVTVTKALTISGNGNTLALTGTFAVRINAPGEDVVLRDINLNGRDAVDYGVRVLNARSVHIHECDIGRFLDDGIAVAKAGIAVFVTDTNVHDSNAGLDGERSGRLTVDGSIFENNSFRGVSGGNLALTATNSLFSNNGDDGFQSSASAVIVWSDSVGNGASGYTVNSLGRVLIESSVARRNTGIAGVTVFGSGIVTLSNVTSVQNTRPINATEVRTRENNRFVNNDFDVAAGTITPLSGM